MKQLRRALGHQKQREGWQVTNGSKGWNAQSGPWHERLCWREATAVTEDFTFAA